jgi:hypothetical protein
MLPIGLAIVQPALEQVFHGVEGLDGGLMMC